LADPYPRLTRTC